MPTHTHRDVGEAEHTVASERHGQRTASTASDMSFQHQMQCADGAGSPEDGQLAIRMAIDIMNGGYWWQTQPMPQAHATGLALLSDATGAQRIIHGEVRLDAFDSAIRCLRGAEAGVDPAWIASEYRPRAQAERRDIIRGIAQERVLDTVDALDGSESTPGAELLALEIRLDQLSSSFADAEQYLTLSNASLAQKVGKAIDWGEVMGDRTILDPHTGAPVQLTSGAQILDLIHRMKSVLRTANAVSNGLPSPESTSAAGGLAEAFELVKTVSEGTIGLAGLCCEGVAWSLYAAARYAQEAGTAASLTSHAETFTGYARSIAGAPGVSGALAAIDLVRHSLKLAAPDTSSDDRLDAGVGVATALANLGAAGAKALEGSTSTLAGSASAIGATCTAASVAIPVTWLVFKAAVRGMGETTINITRWRMVGDFERLIASANGAVKTSRGITTALMMRDRELDPDLRAGFDTTSCNFAESLSGELAEMRRAGGFEGRVARAQLMEALEHPGASGNCRDPRIVIEAVDQLSRHVTWCLDNADSLVHAEAGYRELPTRTKSRGDGKTDRLGECETEP